MIVDDSVIVIRVAKKLRGDGLPFGTTVAYVVPAKLPIGVALETLTKRLREAAKALGLTRAICMVDFIVRKNEIVLLEMTPRIGGDCLPQLIRKCCGLDTIGLALDFAEGRECEIPHPERWKELVGIRLFATSSGTLGNVNSGGLLMDTRVKEIFIKRAPGHEIKLPPEDYDSWMLGHVILEPEPGVPLPEQCKELTQQIVVRVEQYPEQRFAWFESAGDRFDQSPSATA
jgi:biotin carboxylase